MAARGTGDQSFNATPISPRDDSDLSSLPTSASTHTSTSSPPTTPPRGRHAARYPESLGRVPLHRRGTSKTYERLEDLLREAGYKETRVFTPETERTTDTAIEREANLGASGVRGGVGAVVGFLASLTDSQEGGSARVDPQPWSPPPSPLSRALHVESLQPPSNVLHLATRRSHVDLSTDTSKRTHARPPYPAGQHHQSARGSSPHHPHSQSRPHQHQHQHLPHYGHHHNNITSTSSTKPDAHSARAYLRHMASAPNIQPLMKRPSSSQTSLRSQAHGHDRRNGSTRSRRHFVLNDEDSIAESVYDRRLAHPPLPSNWVEAIARAILSGGGGGTAEPSEGLVASDTASTKTLSTHKTSSALSDKSNQQLRGRDAARGAAGARPPPKAKTSEGWVSCTKVTCRSAPTSRASSRVRTGVHDEYVYAKNGGRRGRERPARSHRSKGKDKESDIVPSLARTRVESDEWAPHHRYLAGWATTDSGAQLDGASSDGSDDDDEDEEGELGLDRLLVPARRQHSIQSLRRHLQRSRPSAASSRGVPPRSPKSGALSPFGAAPASGDRTGKLRRRWARVEDRRWLAGEGDEAGEEEGHGSLFSDSEAGTGRSSIKRRQGIPGPWAQ
ncbi:hypothetical protein BU15DRAFT_89446 [Melanogaster broomeanus]|nr:hypothetical protein BU15DRAFT_89446 [Melanogaster broomeanus]